MKVKFIALAFLLLLTTTTKESLACSAFAIKKDSKVLMFKSYDWHFGSGVVMYNPANIHKKSIPVNGNYERVNWSSKYASITFNQYGQNLPNGGINETGLTIEVLWLESTKYSHKEHKKALNELQWIQYALDNFNNVGELIEHTSEINVVPFYAKVHYFITDSEGNSTVIEFINGKRVVHSGKQLPHQAITNSTYQQSIHGLQNSKPTCQRFNRICSSIDESAKPNVNYGFGVLDQVKGDNTQWQIAYDITNKTIYFKTKPNGKLKSKYMKSKSNPEVKTIHFDHFDSTTTETLFLDIYSQSEFTPKNFKKITIDINGDILKEAFTNLKLPVPDSACTILAQFITNGTEHPELQHIIDSFAGIGRQ